LIIGSSVMNFDLFGADSGEYTNRPLGPGVFLFRGFALAGVTELLAAIRQVSAQSIPRSMRTPGGLAMSVATSSCGAAGWVSDSYGYRYAKRDPVTGQPWPAMPEALFRLGQAAAAEAGYPDFTPDSCLVNHYQPGAKMTLHQDKNERDFSQPIVSVSLGLPAVFLFGGRRREDSTQRIHLEHGDVMVWGGPARLNFHGVLPIKPGVHPLVGQQRINLTFRKAL
jgi:DNA oxidative demethylase